MAIEKMVFIKIAGFTEDMHGILKSLILNENLHINIDNTDLFDNSYIIHQLESTISRQPSNNRTGFEYTDKKCNEMQQILDYLCKGLSVELKTDKKCIAGIEYSIKDAWKDLKKLDEQIGPVISIISRKKAEMESLIQLKEKIDLITEKDLQLNLMANLKYFDYEIGVLTRENKTRLRRNYENISAVVLSIGSIQASVEELNIVIYPSNLKDETHKLLKALNWVKLDIPADITGTPAQMSGKIGIKIQLLKNEINELSVEHLIDSNETCYLLNKIYTQVMLERKINEMARDLVFGETSFVLNAFVKKKDTVRLKQALNTVTERIIIEEKNVDKAERQVMPPTEFKNIKLIRPFEEIIKLYGLPSYYEIDPTPFIAVTFCLMFGFMFGDIGQGLIYLLSGIFIKKRKAAVGDILARLGGSSIIFGFFYGSFFGLEKSELSWLPGVIGKPLEPENIPMILLSGVLFGVIVLTVSYIFGTINSLKKGNIEDGIFGKNGITGYLFFISLLLTVTTAANIIPVPVTIPVVCLLLSFSFMLARQPLTNLLLNKRPVIHGSIGTYLTESIFEGVETLLATMSNAISFIRVGAFALNHAGLFLAFLVLSQMTSNLLLKILVIILGNILILTLEGLVVFIQGLRLQYYEMFSRYFQGEGVKFNPVKISS